MSIGINWADIWAPVWKAVWTTEVAPQPTEQPAGAIRRKRRWAIEHNGELVEFSTAQAAMGWLGRQNKKAKKAAQAPQPTAAPTEAPQPIPVSAITFDGVKLGRMMVDGQRAVDRLRTMRTAEIALVEAHIREIQEEEDIIARFIDAIA